MSNIIIGSSDDIVANYGDGYVEEMSSYLTDVQWAAVDLIADGWPLSRIMTKAMAKEALRLRAENEELRKDITAQREEVERLHAEKPYDEDDGRLGAGLRKLVARFRGVSLCPGAVFSSNPNVNYVMATPDTVDDAIAEAVSE